MARGVFGCSALLAASLYAAMAAAEPSPGFTFCVAPDPPECIDAPAKSERNNDECEARVQAYVANVFRFRECLEAESERQIRRANEALDRWKCKRSKDCQKR